MRFAELEFLVEYSFVRAPPSGGGSNASRPAVFVPHIHRRERGRVPSETKKARSCKNTAYRGGISEILVESQCLQRLDNLQKWHHFQTVLYNVWNFAVAYSRALVLRCTFLLVRLVSWPFYCFLIRFCSFCQLEIQFSVWIHLNKT